MKSISYSVLQYKHDCALDESVNLGVLAFSAAERKAVLAYDRTLGHLSKLYLNFDRLGVLASLKALQRRLDQMNIDAERSLFPPYTDDVRSAENVLRMIWPDAGSSLHAAPLRFAASDDVACEAQELFERFVGSLRDNSVSLARRDDRALWESVLLGLRKVAGFSEFFTSKEFGGEIEVEYASQRSSDKLWVGIEPVSFDYMEADSVRDRTFKLVGKAVGLDGVPDFHRLVVVIGDEKRNSDVHEAIQWSTSFLQKHTKKVSVVPESRVSDVPELLLQT